MSITLDQTLDLVGKLDDSPGEDTPRERFRRFLQQNVKEVGQVRDYIEDCLRKPGDQYNRALQDLVNYLGQLLEFEVTFGRYHGVQREIGFDGHWKSPTGIHLVVEVKTTEVYAIKAATLVGYVDELISSQKIPSWHSALGLYVVGRPDPEVRQLENAIVAEKSTNQLRVTTVESLLSIAELMSTYDVSHQDVLAILRPSGPTIDPLVDLMSRLVAQEPMGAVPAAGQAAVEELTYEAQPTYWLTPVKGDEECAAEDVVKNLVGEEKVYAWASRTPGRKDLKPGDWICLYATGNVVIGHAKVRTKPEERHHPKVRNPEKYRWVFNLEDSTLHLDEPTIIDAALRGGLDAFRDKPPTQTWAWFVQATHKLSRHDFEILTRQTDSE